MPYRRSTLEALDTSWDTVLQKVDGNPHSLESYLILPKLGTRVSKMLCQADG